MTRAGCVPPQYVHAPSALVYEQAGGTRLQLSRVERMTGLRLWGLGWRHRYERSDPMTLEELLEVCGVEKSQFMGHLRRLVDAGVLRYTQRGVDYVFHFDCSQPADPAPARASPENRTGRRMTVVVDPADFETEAGQQQQIIDARALLVEAGFPAALAQELAQRCGLARVRDVLAARDRGVIWSAGGVRRALEEGWSLEPLEAEPGDDGQRYIAGKYGEFIEH